MIKQLIAWLTGAPVEQIGEYFRERQAQKHELELEELKAKGKYKQAKWEAKAAREAHYGTWEMAQIANSGWKDEFVLATISFPLYGAFLPWTQDAVREGFRVLGTTPAWYMGIVMTVYLAVYGVRWRHAESIRILSPRSEQRRRAKGEGRRSRTRSEEAKAPAPPS